MYKATIFSALFALGLTAVGAAPLEERAQKDAPFTVSNQTLSAAINCPNGIVGKAGGVVLLVHGTGYTGETAWKYSPYLLYLPKVNPGYDVCWVDLPNRSLDDAQVAAEYIAYNIPKLAAKSKTKKIAIVGHSQGGGLNPQWALTFWPSTRKYVTAYIALAGDFHGSAGSAFLCSSRCPASVWQQIPTSAYLTAQNTLGGRPLVPTTSIYTNMDQVLLNNFDSNGNNASSILPGATNIKLQASNVCGGNYQADHFTMLYDSVSFILALDAFANGGKASPARALRSDDCQKKRYNVYNDDSANNNQRTSGAIQSGAAVIQGTATAEPKLKKYVCTAGAATNCG